MCSRVYLLDGGETVGIYSEVEHEVLKIMLKPLPTLKTTLSPSSTPHSRGGAAPFARRSLRQSPWAGRQHTKHVAWRACQNRELGSGVRTIQEA